MSDEVSSSDPRRADAEERATSGADRLPSGTRVGRVHLQIADLDRSIAYYRDVLGLEVLERSSGQATLGTASGSAVLIELRERNGIAPVPQRGRLGLYHYALLLPDRPALGRFVRHLAEVGERAGASDHLVSEALYLHDPDGLGIEVYADRPRSAWRYRAGELAMASDPLDLADLVRAAGNEPWRGMPDGTAVGHIHLHVGDLRRAADFYQDALGFDTTVSSYPGALFLSAGGYHHHLGVNTWAGAGARPASQDEARLLDWELLLPDRDELAAAAHRLEARGYEIQPAGDGWTSADPWGIMLRLAISSEA